MTTAPLAAGTVAAERTGRLWEVDVARTAAIAMMVVFHLVYDVHFLSSGAVGPNPDDLGWEALRAATGISFVGVAGLAFWISSARARERGLRGAALWRKHARRGLEVLGWGLVVSVVTLVALGPDEYVRFGVLSAIGASILLAPLVVRLGVWNAVLGAAVVVLGLVAHGVESDVPGALVLGFAAPQGAGVDWYPLMPWFGVFAIGMAVGAWLYPAGRRGPVTARLPEAAPVPPLAVPGRHSLAIYLVHQPVLIALLAAGLSLAGVDLAWR